MPTDMRRHSACGMAESFLALAESRIQKQEITATTRTTVHQAPAKVKPYATSASPFHFSGPSKPADQDWRA